MLSLVFALLSSPGAHAADLGTTWYQNLEIMPNEAWLSAGGVYPSLDLKMEGIDLQIHVLEFIHGLTADQIYLGANLFLPGSLKPMGGEFSGTLRPGVSLDIDTDTDLDRPTLAAAGLLRLGGEVQGAMGGGLYVVPALGFGISDSNVDLVLGGSLQVSFWLLGE